MDDVAANLRVNHELVRLLASALEDAKAGRIKGGGVVAVIDAVRFMAFAADGGMPGSVIAGAELMKTDVIARMRDVSRKIMRAPLPGLPGGAPLNS